jgi:hypothetical protein
MRAIPVSVPMTSLQAHMRTRRPDDPKKDLAGSRAQKAWLAPPAKSLQAFAICRSANERSPEIDGQGTLGHAKPCGKAAGTTRSKQQRHQKSK